MVHLAAVIWGLGERPHMLTSLFRYLIRFRFKALGLAVCLTGALFASGCSEPLTLYHVPGSEAYLVQGRKILILPFMDTRTFIAKEDQDRTDIGDYTRSIFVEALREFNADRVVELMTPKMARRTRSLTNAQVAELGRRHGADLVVAGQVFSFTGTRAASIPPRAGLFIRIINSQDGSLMFAGDHYRAANVPGASGGRDLQALYVSAQLIEGFLSRLQPVVAAAGDIASIGAFAMLSPEPIRQGLIARLFKQDDEKKEIPKRKLFAWSTQAAPRVQLSNLFNGDLAHATANNIDPNAQNDDGRKRREPGNVPETERYLGMTASFLFSPEQWDEQLVPEIPPLVDFDQDFYELPAPLPEDPTPERPNVSELLTSAKVEVGVDADAQGQDEPESFVEELIEEGEEEVLAMEPEAPPLIAQPEPIIAEAPAASPEPSQPKSEALAPPAAETAPLVVEAKVMALAVEATSASTPEAVADFPLATVEVIVPVADAPFVQTESVYAPVLPEPVIVSAAPMGTMELFAGQILTYVRYAHVDVDPTSAMEIHELPEIDMAKVYPNYIAAGAVYPPPMPSAQLSGDELASDLWAAAGNLWPEPEIVPDFFPPDPVMTPLPDDFAIAMMPETPVLLSEPVSLPAAMADSSGTYLLDPDTLQVVEGPMPRERMTVASRMRAEGRIARPRARDAVGETAGVSAPGKKLSARDRANTRRKTRNQSVKGMAVSRPTVEQIGIPIEAPIAGMAIISEQPRTFKSVNKVVNNVMPSDPYAAMQDPAALIAMPGFGGADGVKVLVLPYHERDNPNNLIYNTGGGEVVTTYFGTQLASDPGIRVMWDGSGQATHNRLLTREEALDLGRFAGADYVMRGQVVEFRRAQSVPSFYSAVLSTAVLAAQLFFAEMSGVDVATEVYRVSDGMCVMSRRDRSQQKYVVQAEKTVRRMAAWMARDVSSIIRQPMPEPMDPLIDSIDAVAISGDSE